jgi:hypothetical protein
MYSILDRPPCKNDCNIKQLKAFEAYYGGVDVKFTEICDAILEQQLPGPPVDCERDFLDFGDANSNNDISWFKETLGKLVVRPGIHVQGIGKVSK